MPPQGRVSEVYRYYLSLQCMLHVEVQASLMKQTGSPCYPGRIMKDINHIVTSCFPSKRSQSLNESRYQFQFSNCKVNPLTRRWSRIHGGFVRAMTRPLATLVRGRNPM
jgi:hypothetical protein